MTVLTCGSCVVVDDFVEVEVIEGGLSEVTTWMRQNVTMNGSEQWNWQLDDCMNIIKQNAENKIKSSNNSIERSNI